MTFAASRLGAVKASASAMISQSAKAMARAGEDVIDLGLGEPDFDTPPHIVEAAHQAGVAGETRYPPTAGTAALITAVRDKFARENGLAFESDEVIVSNGAKQVIFGAFMATLEPGQEVILCAPYFDSYRSIVSILGGQHRTVACTPEDGFRLTPEALEAAITPNTRWLLLNAPSNPSGATYSASDFKALGKVLARHPHVLIMSDDIYEHILFDGARFQSFAAVYPDLADRILTVNGVSKAYAMTGWRIGYGAGPSALIKAMVTVQSQISSGACSIAQAGAVAALTGPQDHLEVFRTAFERRRDLVMAKVAGIKGLSLLKPGGAFYALIGCHDLIEMRDVDGVVLADDAAVAAFILKRAGVAVVPGSVYEMPGYFRISTASADDLIARAMDRIASAIDNLQT